MAEKALTMSFSAPPVKLPAGLADIGAPTNRPFVILAWGQSNMAGTASEGSKVVEAGIYITNDRGAPTGIIPAVLGQTPLGTINGLSCNNMAVHFANNLRRSGMIPASRPIIIIPNWLGGRSIAYWLADSPTPQVWNELALHISVINAAYPGFTIDHIMGAQGENDGSSGGTYGSAALYGAAFTQLVGQWRSLPQVTASTTISAQELGAWYNNAPGCARNDFIRTLKDGAYDPLITMVSSSGTAEGTESPGPHFDGNSLVLLGQRHFAAWAEARAMGRYGNASGTDKFGSAPVVPRTFTISTGDTLSLGLEDLRANKACVIANGGTLNLPSSSLFATCEVVLVVGANNVTLNASSAISNTFLGLEYAVAGQTTTTLPRNTIYKATLANQTWFIESIFPRYGGSVMYNRGISINTNFSIDSAMMRFGSFLLLGNNTVTLPAPANGAMAAFYTVPGVANSTISGTLVTPSGVSVASYVVPAGAAVVVIGLNAQWVVVSDTLARLSHAATGSRPTGLASTDRVAFFDDTLGKPIWWNGTTWKDATGATV